MESTIMFPAGEYYIGDLGRVLPSDSLRMVMSELLKYGGLKNLSSVRELISSDEVDYYWVARTPNITGCFYDQKGKAWGFDWGMFGCMPFKWVSANGSHEENKVKFDKQFDFEVTNELIRIGHLIFTLNPNIK